MRSATLLLSTIAFTLLAPKAQAGTCSVSTSRETVTCTDGAAAPISVATTAGTGFVLRIDMDRLSMVTVDGSISSGSGWLLNLGDSATNNGYCGDGATTSNDSELWITGTNVYLCDSDRGGSDYIWSWIGALATSGNFRLMVSDGAVMFQNRTTGAFKVESSDTLFQVDGDEPDAEASRNDTLLYLGLNRVISGPGSRTGSGLGDLSISYW